ncbi:winged helix DNA-binding domain-containing protein [Amycolatopsis saalfeldensis]|uniref:Winged helix DNA-binding domain-containing protein n=1 Tax=Amycolatopsis saalfeldensis TaxID=394193 RepID=A0A1H8YDW3_9PSEU|nr:winged helix DNA-binding domain-containing protein [Amycolatopsis saalfeldensis]SEP50329.1 Winged helix DNA-binding domain-containing protein [Amycolatopsis saalfeldensis]
MNLSRRALSRATLDRQLLLRRVKLPAFDAVEHLAGLQAQAPFPPYYALHARLHGFRPEDLSKLLLDRQVVRLVLMRGTVHLVSAADALAWRPLVQVIMDRDLDTNVQFAAKIAGLDRGAVTDVARKLLAARPHSGAELGAALASQWPDRPAGALTHLARGLLPLVQIPPQGVWGSSGQPTYQLAHDWIGGPAPVAPSLTELVRRYLKAFGPASVADAQAWAGVTRLGEVFAEMDLRAYRDPDGRVLYDLPEAVVPEEDGPMPLRLLGPFDQTLLAYADRRRVISDEHRKRVITQNGLVKGTLLAGGQVRGSWETAKAGGKTTLTVTPFERLAKRDVTAAESAGRKLLAWSSPGTESEVRVLTAS